MNKRIVDLMSDNQRIGNSERENNQMVIRNLQKNLAKSEKELKDTKEYCNKLIEMKDLHEEEKSTFKAAHENYKKKVAEYHVEIVSRFNEKDKELSEATKKIDELKNNLHIVVTANMEKESFQAKLKKDLEAKTKECDELRKKFNLFSSNLHVIEEDEITSWEVPAAKALEILPPTVIKIEETEQPSLNVRSRTNDLQGASVSQVNGQTLSDLIKNCDIDLLMDKLEEHKQSLDVNDNAQRKNAKESRKRKINTL